MGFSEKPSWKFHGNVNGWFPDQFEQAGQFAHNYNGNGGSSNNNEYDNNTWVIAGIKLRAPLKPVAVKAADVDKEKKKKKRSKKTKGSDPIMATSFDDYDGDDYCSTTPTSAGSRIPETLMRPPPPPPRKRKPAPRCSFRGKDFFSPPDLETVFIRRQHQPC